MSQVLGRVDDVPPGKMSAYPVAGKQIAVANVDGRYFAFDDVCTHFGCSLAAGELAGNVVTCPCHGSEFDVRDGSVIAGPARKALGIYAVETDGGEVRIEVPPPEEAATPTPTASKGEERTPAAVSETGGGQASILARVPLFAGLDESSLSGFGAFTFRRTFNPGDVILEEGRTGNGLYVVLSGQVEVVKGLGGERPQIAATLGPGEPFGEMALLGDWKRSASVRAVGEVECLGMDRWVFLAHLKREPQVAIMLLHLMAQRLAETNERLLE